MTFAAFSGWAGRRVQRLSEPGRPGRLFLLHCWLFVAGPFLWLGVAALMAEEEGSGLFALAVAAALAMAGYAGTLVLFRRWKR